MPSLTDLTPAERARLLGKPEGELGIALSKVMNQTNAKVIDTVYRRLGLKASDTVLEIGFGNGQTVPHLLHLADAISYVGIDIAETMVAEASAFNEDLIQNGRATFRVASAEAIPYSDGSFNRVVAVNVIYFWPDPIPALIEIRRVLRTDGFSIVAGIDTATAAVLPMYRAEYGFHVREADDLVALHREAGFTNIDVEPYDEVVTQPDGKTYTRHYSLVLASP